MIRITPIPKHARRIMAKIIAIIISKIIVQSL
jgi:hypothetical protein